MFPAGAQQSDGNLIFASALATLCRRARLSRLSRLQHKLAGGRCHETRHQEPETIMGLQNEKISALSFVTADLNYLALAKDRPRTYTFEPPSGEPRSNIVPEPHALRIYDARPISESISLDREGFALIRQHSAVMDFYDEEEVRNVYYPEAEHILKVVTGADRVFVFDHTVRKRVDAADLRDRNPRQPVARVHVDHTARSGPQRVRDLIPDEADELLKGRVQIINLWRPIRGPLRDSPLAVCDARTVKFDELVGSDLVYPHRIGETYSVKYSSEHRWFYVPGMTPDEILLLKCFDSKADGTARFAPHTAFADPTTPRDASPRESIELRTLVFHAA
jgi:hypothetical protein